jgi:hypothetical protein
MNSASISDVVPRISHTRVHRSSLHNETPYLLGIPCVLTPRLSATLSASEGSVSEFCLRQWIVISTAQLESTRKKVDVSDPVMPTKATYVTSYHYPDFFGVDEQ